jgi:hypothetical protein
MISNNLLKRTKRLYLMIYRLKKRMNSKRKNNKDFNKLNKMNKDNMKFKKLKEYCSREELKSLDLIQKLNLKSISIDHCILIKKILRK